MEYAGALYHVINRGNYRADVFATEGAKRAFVKALDETASKQGWRVYAWALMSNHYHLALETPQPNLVDGMKELQGTFATRFNRLRRENGHVFQGRYKSLLVETGAHLGMLCHYIHLNPVRAGLCAVEQLDQWPWTSLPWLMRPKLRATWYDAAESLLHAGELADTRSGRENYAAYLGWLQENKAAQKEARFERMSKGWVIGSRQFKRDLLEDHRALLEHGAITPEALAEGRELRWEEELGRLLQRIDRRADDLAVESKSAPWKVALGAALKQKTTVTNRWLSERLNLGNLYEVSRKVNAWQRDPEPEIARLLGLTPNPKA
jgi:REP element-mobilizing transposase RayT